MSDLTVLFTVPAASVPGVTAARLDYNKPLPLQIPDANGVMVPNPGLKNTDAEFLTYSMTKMVESLNAQYKIAPAPAPVGPVIINGVPQEVTRRQAVQALINTGKFDAVQPAINAITDPVQKATMQNEWDNSTTFQRQRPSLIMMGTAIGEDAAGLDNLFILANTL